jgi:hypothetical protein
LSTQGRIPAPFSHLGYVYKGVVMEEELEDEEEG